MVDPFRVEYRTRDAALFAEEEWGWGSQTEAYIFEQYHEALLPDGAYEKSAESHVKALRERGEPHAHAIQPFVASDAWLTERALRRPGSEQQLMASVREAGVLFDPRFDEVEEKPAVVAPSKVRSSGTISERIDRARRGKRSSRRRVAPDEAYARMEREGLA